MCAQSEVMKLHFCFLLIVALDFTLRSRIHLHSFLYMIYNLVYGKIGSNLFCMWIPVSLWLKISTIVFNALAFSFSLLLLIMGVGRLVEYGINQVSTCLTA